MVVEVRAGEREWIRGKEMIISQRRATIGGKKTRREWLVIVIMRTMGESDVTVIDESVLNMV
jgi:hypothetical protein